MLAHERHQKILQILQETHSIRISEIADRFEVSNETARRDLEYLQKKGMLRRVHGGANLIPSSALLDQFSNVDHSVDHEPVLSICEKIAQAAFDLVEDDDIIFISHGTTMHQFSRVIRNKKNLTVLTNSIQVINELLNCPVTLYALGGLIDRDEQNMNGSIPISVIQQFYANKAFLSCGGITISGEVSDYHSDGTLQHLMLQHAEKRYLIADSSKFGRNAFCKICDLRDFDIIISDNQLSLDYQELITRLNVNLRLV